MNMPLKPVQSSECSQKKKGKRGLRRQTQSLSALALKGSTSLNLYNVTCQLQQVGQSSSPSALQCPLKLASMRNMPHLTAIGFSLSCVNTEKDSWSQSLI